MPTTTSPKPRSIASDITLQALTGLLLTSAHHAYGAYVYHTPWRYHVLLVAIPAAAVIVGSQAVVRADPGGIRGKIARGVFLATTVALPVLAFGVFEGFYNHPGEERAVLRGDLARGDDAALPATDVRDAQ